MNKPPATEREHNTVTYMALKDDLKKLNEIARSDAPDAMERYTALSDEITAKYQSPEDASEIADFLLNGYLPSGGHILCDWFHSGTSSLPRHGSPLAVGHQ